MAITDAERSRRIYENFRRPTEYRTEYQRDYDRLIYSSALRRLGGVTQTVNPAEGQSFHNRLTHSLKVAQIGFRISEKIKNEHNTEELLQLGGLDPNVVQAAALAHDLGNPPFGHLAEKELDELIKKKGEELGVDIDGFEGNAQSFRIVNKLSYGYDNICGINLTCATLNAILKYPWSCTNKPLDNTEKFGVYSSEFQEFEDVRKSIEELGLTRTLEASIMDLSDDITYAIHDFEDFFRANLIPSGEIFEEADIKELEKLIKYPKEPWYPIDHNKSAEEEVKELLIFYGNFPFPPKYSGKHEQRVAIHSFSSSMIKRIIDCIDLNFDSPSKSPIILKEPAASEIILLKQLTKQFVWENPNLLRQQYGAKKNIRFLFNNLCSVMEDSKWMKLFPISSQERLENLSKKNDKVSKQEKIRIVADTISYLTDSEALRLYKRLNGNSVGSIFDSFIV